MRRPFFLSVVTKKDRATLLRPPFAYLAHMHSRFSLRVCAILVAQLPFGSASAQSEPPFPQGRAGDAARAYLAAINTSDSTKIRAWLVQYDPEGDMTVRTGRQLSVARRTGGFAIERIIRGEPAGAAPGRPPAPGPGRGGQGGTPSGASGPTTISETELVRLLRALADSLQRAGQFSGVISLTKKGAPVFEQAYGNANRELRIPNTRETAFNLGSINKLFTATAIRQLAATGRLALDSTLARAWPEYPNKDVARQVTLRQIREHRSGIMGDIFNVPGVADPGELVHNRQFLVGFVNEPLRFPPGSREAYSNAGYVVLGGVVERADKRSSAPEFPIVAWPRKCSRWRLLHDW